MKHLFQTVAMAAALVAPIAAFAQSNAPATSLTRSQVRADLAEYEQAGYSPVTDSPNYPSNLQAAQTRVIALTRAGNADTGYGGSIGRSSATGTRVVPEADRSSVYFGD
jgi:hypothetical protein